MARTPISIQAQFLQPDASPALGQISVRATASVHDAGVLYTADVVRGIVNQAGQLTDQSLEALVIWATDDAGIAPDDPALAYVFSVQMSGAALWEFEAYVPGNSTAPETNGSTTSGSRTISLGSLVPSMAMVGQPISGDHLPGGATVTGYNSIAGTLTISAPASATQAGGCQFVVGGAVLLSVLATGAL